MKSKKYLYTCHSSTNIIHINKLFQNHDLLESSDIGPNSFSGRRLLQFSSLFRSSGSRFRYEPISPVVSDISHIQSRSRNKKSSISTIQHLISLILFRQKKLSVLRSMLVVDSISTANEVGTSRPIPLIPLIANIRIMLSRRGLSHLWSMIRSLIQPGKRL